MQEKLCSTVLTKMGKDLLLQCVCVFFCWWGGGRLGWEPGSYGGENSMGNKRREVGQ